MPEHSPQDEQDHQEHPARQQRRREDFPGIDRHGQQQGDGRRFHNQLGPARFVGRHQAGQESQRGPFQDVFQDAGPRSSLRRNSGPTRSRPAVPAAWIFDLRGRLARCLDRRENLPRSER